MGKYNVNGVYYHCAANGKDYSRDEWGKFCDDTRYTDAIVATYFGFQWNAHDVCRNPHTTEIYRDNRSFIEKMQAINIILILLTCKLSENCLYLYRFRMVKTVSQCRQVEVLRRRSFHR